MNSPKRRIFAGAIALTFVAAACGSDDATTNDTSAPAETSATTEGDMTETTDGAMPETTDGGEAMAEVSGTLVGAGASSQAAAMQGWQAGFQALNPDATVEYDPVGSGGGRETFLDGGTDFAGSDSALDEEEYAASIERCAGDQGAINLPHYISPIAIPYNLPSLDGETLNLSPDVIAGIFANTITVWNDPAIAADNLVPSLEDGDIRLSQSMAIIEYLDEKHPAPALLPADALGRARVRALAQSIACEIHPLNNLRVLKYLSHEMQVEEEVKNTW